MYSESTLPIGRQRLAAVVRESGDIVRIEDVMRILGFERQKAGKLLSRWRQQGWMRRVGPGLYAPVEYALLGEETLLEDPWILVPNLYDPSYIGSRTALEYWDLTEQMFIDTVVFTTRVVRARFQKHDHLCYTVKHISENKIFGTKVIWVGLQRRTKVFISDLERTIVDILDDPVFGGGIRFVSDCIFNYLQLKNRDDEKLIAYADQLGNGAIFKRLGYLAEPVPNTELLIAACRARLTQGNVKVDPQIPKDRLITRWRLFVPGNWSKRHPYAAPR